MTKHAKITLSGARDIPFSALMLSQAKPLGAGKQARTVLIERATPRRRGRS